MTQFNGLSMNMGNLSNGNYDSILRFYINKAI